MSNNLRIVCIAAAALVVASCSYAPPDCGSAELLKNSTDVVNSNEQVKAAGVTVKEVRNLKESAHDDAKKTRTCKGDMELSNGQMMDLQIDLAQDPKDETIYIPTVRWSPKG